MNPQHSVAMSSWTCENTASNDSDSLSHDFVHLWLISSFITSTFILSFTYKLSVIVLQI